MMTSIVPGGDVPPIPPSSHSISHKNGKGSKETGRPINPAKTNGTFGGRKFVDPEKSVSVTMADNSIAPATSARARSKNKVSNPDDIDKLLANDADALLNMRKDIHSAQEVELKKAKKALAAIQKEHDALKTQNDGKEKKLRQFVDKKNTLQNLETESITSGESYQNIINNLEQQYQGVNENMNAEIRTRDVMVYMSKRLNDEIMKCKTESHTLTQQLDLVKAELVGVESSLRLSKQELIEEERSVGVLTKTIKVRNEERVSKMGELQSIVLDGEASIAKVQESMEEALRLMRESELPPDGRPAFSVSKSEVRRSKDEDSKLETMLNLMSPSQIREIVDRYNSSNDRVKKLNQIQADLREQITSQKKRKQHIDNLMLKSQDKLQLLASNRQVYQEVDMKDAALNSARKESDDCQEREHRLKSSIEGLRRAIPRFLVKVNKSSRPQGGSTPVPIDALADVVHKLDDEVARLIKQIGEKMLKDATPEDLVSMNASAQHHDNTSETSRLHKLPGYARLRKQLFLNLMSAVPNATENNVRVTATDPDIDPHVVVSHHVSHHGHIHKGAQKDNSNRPDRDRAGGDEEDKENNTDDAQHNQQERRKKLSHEEVIDRGTIKNISRLIVRRDKMNMANGASTNAKKKKGFGSSMIPHPPPQRRLVEQRVDDDEDI